MQNGIESINPEFVYSSLSDSVCLSSVKFLYILRSDSICTNVTTLSSVIPLTDFTVHTNAGLELSWTLHLPFGTCNIFDGVDDAA